MAKKRPETAQHAIDRMRRDGYSDAAIAGQFRRWHPDRPPPAQLVRPPRTTLPPTSGMGAAAAAQGASYVDRTPVGGKDATIWAAKHSPAVAVHLLAPPPPKQKPLPTMAPYKQGHGPVPLVAPPGKVFADTKSRYTTMPRPTAPPPTRDQQYRWAQQAPVKPGAAKKLADSMTTDEKLDVLHPGRHILPPTPAPYTKIPGLVGGCPRRRDTAARRRGGDQAGRHWA